MLLFYDVLLSFVFPLSHHHRVLEVDWENERARNVDSWRETACQKRYLLDQII
jgi:hypothetical protein